LHRRDRVGVASDLHRCANGAVAHKGHRGALFKKRFCVSKSTHRCQRMALSNRRGPASARLPDFVTLCSRPSRVCVTCLSMAISGASRPDNRATLA
jgi:hypothetical protein